MSNDTFDRSDALGRLWTAEAQMARPATIRQRLDLAVKEAEERLAATKRAKELFEKNPDLEELLNIMQRAHF